jgi:hypothetical protein
VVLIKSSSRTLEQEFTRLIWFYRRNPIIAAKHLLRRNGKEIHLFPYQCVILKDWWNKKFNHLTASRGSGKALAHGSKVLTSSGFVNIEDIKFGDKVLSPSGEEVTVQGVFPQGKVNLFDVKFRDGRVSRCCEDHLWHVYGVKYLDAESGSSALTSCKGWNTVRLKDLKYYLDHKAEKHHNSVRVPLVEDIFIEEYADNLPIHPYVLGALIGDGNYTHTDVGFSTADSFILEKLKRLCPEGTYMSYNSGYDYCFRGCNSDGKPIIRSALEHLGCHGQKSWEKKIPERYMHLNREQTLELVQGLMDTDGCADSIKNSATFSTTSRVLAEQLQSLVWKLGGICKLSPRTTSYTYGGKKGQGRESYRLHIRYPNNKELFSLPRKVDCLKSSDQYSDNLGLQITEVVPAGTGQATCISVDSEDELFVTDDYIVTHNTFLCAVFIALRLLLFPGERLGIFAPSYRQSKLIFDEFTKLVDESPLLRECIEKMPTKGNDMCVCRMKRAASGVPAGYVMALPVGTDGSKIRGLRFDTIFIDECVQLPEVIFSSVIFPMLSTSLDPVESVKAEENKQRLIEENPELQEMLAEERSEVGGGNYISITSGYYQFNYWWEMLKNFWHDMRQNGDSSPYSLRFVPWNDLPDGFLNKSVVMSALANNPSHMFLTEWAAEWISDSSGAFPMSLLTQCRDRNLVPYSNRDMIKHKGCNYVFGIDVARDKDSTTICVMETGYINKVVHLVEIEGGTKSYQEQAAVILDLVFKFEPEKIYMDAGGGHGTALEDLLAKPEALDVGAHLKSLKIVSDKSDVFTSGKRILHMCDFTNQFIADANNSVKLLLEQGSIRFPDCENPILVMSKPDAKGKRREIDLVQKMLDQIASIEITKTGVKELPRYDLKKKKASTSEVSLDEPRKDLYTAFILAGKCAYDLGFKPYADLSVPSAGIVTEISGRHLTPSLGSAIMDSGGLVTPPTSRIITGVNQAGVTKIRNGGIIVSRDGRRKGRR